VYDTPTNKIQNAIEIIKKIVDAEKGTSKGKCEVYFDEFSSSSLDLLVIYWIKDLAKIFTIKNDINFKIKKAFEKGKIEFAYPTQTIYTKK
jgi:MscS family membrane protein